MLTSHELARRARAARLLVGEESTRADAAYFASALSIGDILAVLFGGLLRGQWLDGPERERLALSTGHAALG